LGCIFVSFHGYITHTNVRELFVLSIKDAVHLCNEELPWLIVQTLRKSSFVCRLQGVSSAKNDGNEVKKADK